MSREYYLALDDGFFHLYAIPVSLRELKKAGIILLGPGIPDGKLVRLDDLNKYRLVFGSVCYDTSIEPYSGVEVNNGRDTEQNWIACEFNSRNNYERIDTLMNHLCLFREEKAEKLLVETTFQSPY